MPEDIPGTLEFGLPYRPYVITASSERRDIFEVSEAEEKKTVQLMKQTFEASNFGVDPSKFTRLLCLCSVACGLTILRGIAVRGKLGIDHPGRCSQMFNDHPKFINSAISWLLSYSSEDAVSSSASQALLPCRCNRSDPWIATLHSPGMVQGALKLVAESIFVFMQILMGFADAQRLGRVNEADKLKRAKRCYEVLSDVILHKPELLVTAACSWYKVWDCTAGMHAVSSFVDLHTPNLDLAIRAMDPDIPLLLLQRVYDAIRIRYDNTEDEDTAVKRAADFTGLLLFLCREDNLSNLTVVTVVGPRAGALYELLGTILDSAETLVDFTSGYIHSIFLPTVSAIVKNVHLWFADSHDLGPLRPSVKEFSMLSALDHTVFVGVHVLLANMRELTCCANLSCRKQPPSPFESFNRCAKCLVLCYCSKGCQAQGWNHPEHPHKALCKWWAKVTPVWPRTLGPITASKTQAERGVLDPDTLKADNSHLRQLAVDAGLTDEDVVRVWMDTTNFSVMLNQVG